LPDLIGRHVQVERLMRRGPQTLSERQRQGLALQGRGAIALLA
jgi:hypothetical protein